MLYFLAILTAFFVGIGYAGMVRLVKTKVLEAPKQSIPTKSVAPNVEAMAITLLE